VKDQDSEMMNLLMFNQFPGSHRKNMRELSKWLQKQKRLDGGPKYNITMLVWDDNTDYQESETLHLAKNSHKSTEFKSDEELS
jgi:hypothetical protein